MRGEALQMYSSGRTPPPVEREASSVNEVPGHESISVGAWMSAVGVMQDSRSSGVAWVSHGK